MHSDVQGLNRHPGRASKADPARFVYGSPPPSGHRTTWTDSTSDERGRKFEDLDHLLVWSADLVGIYTAERQFRASWDLPGQVPEEPRCA